MRQQLHLDNYTFQSEIPCCISFKLCNSNSTRKVEVCPVIVLRYNSNLKKNPCFESFWVNKINKQTDDLKHIIRISTPT